MNLTLESLMESLEKQAGLSKQASEDAKEDLKHEKEEDKKEGDAKAALKEAEKDFSSLGKMNKKEESKDEKEAEDKDKSKDKEESKEQTKEAQAAGAELADVLMQKVASVKSTKEIPMNKQASVAGKALADALMTKLANVGDVTTVNGIPEGVAPNKNQIDNANLVAEQDAIIKPLPTKDAIGNGGGSINQIFDAIVADAIGQGGASFDQTAGQGVASHEGAVEASGAPHQVPDESAEKTAAVVSLVNSGVDFDSAVNMVKAAAAEIEAEEAEQVKQAAFNELLGKGVDFDLAVALIKSAGRMDAVKSMGRAALGSAQEGASFAKNVVTGKAMPREVALGGLVRNRAAQGAAAAAAGAGAGVALAHQKKAAVSALIDAGVDFDQAVGLVQAKSDELYGA